MIARPAHNYAATAQDLHDIKAYLNKNLKKLGLISFS